MSLTATQIETAAQLLYMAHGRQLQLPLGDLERTAPQSIEDAYSIQEAVARKLWIADGLRTHTWKTGALPPNAQPYAAPIPPQVVHPSPAFLPAQEFHMIGVESELAYRFARDLPRRERPYSYDEVADAIEGVYVAIEVVDTRLADYQQAGKWWQLADNQINGALVVGNGRVDWRDLDPRQQRVELLLDGVLKDSRQGSHPIVDPRPLLAWVANHCAARNGGLQAGDLVTTGSWTGISFVEPGTEVTAIFPGIGEARVCFPE